MRLISEDDQLIWRDIVRAYNEYCEALSVFSWMYDKVDVVRQALQDDTQRTIALHLLPMMTEADVETLLPDLIAIYLTEEEPPAAIGAALHRLPADHLLQYVDGFAPAILESGDIEAVRGIMALYLTFDVTRFSKYVDLALAHHDIDLRELGYEMRYHLLAQ